MTHPLLRFYDELGHKDPQAADLLSMQMQVYLRAAQDGSPARRSAYGRLMATWRDLAQKPHTTPLRTPQPQAQARPRARRSPRRGVVKTAQDPGDGDPDPDHDPVGEAIGRLLDSAPPFSVGQRQLLARILGGAR
jgi:hypothetical protein